MKRADGSALGTTLKGILESDSNLIVEAPSDVVNLEIRGDVRRELADFVFREGYQFHSGGIGKITIASYGSGSVTLTESNSALLEVKTSAKEAYSRVRVIGYTGTDITVKESFSGDGVTKDFVLSYYPRTIIRIIADGSETWSYRVDGENKVVHMNTAPTSSLDVYYAAMDMVEQSVRDRGIEYELGTRKKEYRELGYWSSSDATDIANRYLRGKYKELEMKIATGSISPSQLCCGMAVTVSYTVDLWSISGT